MIVRHTAAALLVILAVATVTVIARGRHPAPGPDALTVRLAAASSQGKVVPITAISAQAPTIDGDLADWGTMDPRSGCILEGIDDVAQFASHGVRGSAVYSLRSDAAALYLAVRVADASIRIADPVYMGDCIQLFFDVRPASGVGPKLGDNAYSDGVYQLMITAPSPGETTVRWYGGSQKTPMLRGFEIAERLLPDGYNLEMRIPFTSLNGITQERLNDPIGFDISVGDINATPGGGTTPRAEYSLSNSDDGWQDASTFCFARAGEPNRYPAPFIRTQPARYVQTVNSRSIVAGLITTIDATREQSRIDVTCHTANGSASGPAASVRDEVVDYPIAGVRARKRTLELQSLERTRYTLDTHFPGLDGADSSDTFDSIAWRRTAAAGPVHPAGPLPDLPTAAGETRLPNGWHLTPAGRAIPLAGDLPQRIVPSPDGRYLFVSTGGYHDHGVTVIDTITDNVVQRVIVQKTWTGMAFDTHNGELLLSGGGQSAVTSQSKGTVFPGAVLRFTWRGGRLNAAPGIDLPGAAGQTAFVGGIAAALDGALYVVNTPADTVMRLDASRNVAAAAKVGYRPNAVAVAPSQRQVAVASWGDRSVSILDARTLNLVRRIVVGSHPFDLAYGPDGHLFVSCAGANTVCVISGSAVTETIHTSLDPSAPVGSTPTAIALAADGKRLFVANSDNNCVAMIDVSRSGDSRILGFIPTGWYPSALGLARDGDKIYIGTAKGLTFRANRSGEYIGTLLRGHVSVVRRPDSHTLAAFTRQTAANMPSPDASAAQRAALAAASPAFSKIKHVLYIIRENRTYDQLLGDDPRGNGDPSLTLFGRDATPNAHAMAREFVLLDNLYCNGEVSEDGHEWCNAAYATDFTERAWPNSYSDRGEPAADERLTASPAGYLWDNCARHGVSYYSYGEYASFKSSPKTQPVFDGIKGLKGHASLAWTQYSFDRHDTEKTQVFLADLKRAEQTGKWPSYMVMSLGEDHTQGTTPGKYTPQAHVAANDQALGLIVEAISHSRFWPETAIFVIEDDAQDGPDHVDAHRTAGLVISPYIRRGRVESTLYTTASFVATMERILHLPPMTQFDSRATLLAPAFSGHADLRPYNRLAPRVDLEARNGVKSPGAAASARLDFSAYDRASPRVLNQILWEAMRPGTPYPGSVRSVVFAKQGAKAVR